MAYGIMPIFALANAGVSLAGGSFDGSSARVFAGVTLGLVVGKPAGVMLACALALRMRIGVLPVGMTMRHVAVLGMVAGIGFTMSLFIAQLAFASASMLASAKLAVLVGSGAAAMLALLFGRFTISRVGDGAAVTADEAECSDVL